MEAALWRLLAGHLPPFRVPLISSSPSPREAGDGTPRQRRPLAHRQSPGWSPTGTAAFVERRRCGRSAHGGGQRRRLLLSSSPSSPLLPPSTSSSGGAMAVSTLLLGWAGRGRSQWEALGESAWRRWRRRGVAAAHRLEKVIDSRLGSRFPSLGRTGR